MLEDQVAYLLQRYLGNYVRGLNKEALKISVWRGDVELTNMQLKPEALNALKLPVKVKAGFLGSVKLKVPWSRLGQEPVLVYLDQILILAEPATDVEGCSEDAIQDAKKTRVRELELKLLESQQRVKAEMNSSWLGSLINTIIGNLKLSISNVHIRYEDSESNPGHPFAAGIILKKLSAVTVDNVGNETFATGGALDHIQKSVKLESLGMYFDSDILPWRIEKSWNDLLPAEWIQIFEVDKADGDPNISTSKHIYILQPVSGSARYIKLQVDESENTGQPIQKAVVNLEDVTLCLPKDAYRDIVRLADNFNSFNQRLRYAHYRPTVPVKADSRSWWRYAYKVVVDEMKKASGKFSWEQVLKYAKLRKKYVTLYASLLKADVNQVAVDYNEDLEKLDRELDIEVILQWRMLAHKFLEQSAESSSSVNRQQSRRSWWSFGWGGSSKGDNEPGGFSDDDWDRLNRIIGYKEDDEQLMTQRVRGDMLLSLFEIHMEHNASKLITSDQKCLADLSCDGIYFSIKIYPETKTIDLKLSSYRLMSPNGPLAESATVSDSFVGVFIYKPFDALLDWSLVAKASPCYMTYLKETIDEIISFFQSSTAISQTLALETANAVQMTIDGVKRTAQQQVSQALKDHARFSLDLDIAAPKITIPTKFSPDGVNETKLLLDFGNLMLSTQEYWEIDSDDVKDQYLQFNIVLSDVSAVLVDGDHSWNQKTRSPYRSDRSNYNYYLPVIDKCMVALKVQQIESESPVLPSMRISLRFPSLVFYFSPARYHRLMRVVKIFDNENDIGGQTIFPWSNADFEGLVSVLSWKGMGNREAIWQHRYLYLVGPSLYFLETPTSKTYKQYFSLRGKQVFLVPEEFTGNMGNLLAVSDAAHSSSKVVEDLNALILRFDSEDSCKTWQNRFQGAIYRASGPAALSSLSEISSSGDGRAVSRATSYSKTNAEVLFLTGVLDELKIGFSCSYQDNKRHETILLSKESSLFEFRASGGQVELLMKDNNLYIGTLLKSLEIEDQFLHDYHSKIRYLARSFINSMDDIWETTNSSDIRNPKFRNTRVPSFDNEEQFFEASESLGDLSDSSPQYPEGSSVHCGADGHDLSIKPPSFSRIPGLLPDGKLHMESKDLECNTRLDSFVKAQVIFYQQDSPLYSDIDKQVSVTLATLSFFCHRPTILAILEFVNAINSEEDIHDEKQKDFVDSSSTEIVEEAVIKGLLGKGKSRVVFYVSLNMARAQIYLVDETGCYLATLSQNNLLANIKVFPASFSIKAALGNLKISDDSLPHDHSYFWVCDMRNPGGSSFVELDFTSFSAEDDDYFGYDYSLTGQLSEVRIVYLNRFVQEVVSYFMGLLPSSSTSVVKLKDQSSDSEKWFTTNEFEGSPALKLDLSFTRPIIIMPRQTNSLDYLELDVLHITVNNDFHWIGGNKTDMSAVHLETMMIQIKEINLTVGKGNVPGENIIEDVHGLSIILRRSLRDLLHQIPLLETVVEVEKLSAAVSNREYQVITECAISNISETPRTIPVLDLVLHTSSEKDVPESSSVSEELGSQLREEYVSMKVSVIINLVQLQLYMGLSRDTPLATVQAVGAWLLYKSSSSNESSIWATLKSFNVIDDRAGTKEEFRHAIGQNHSRGVFPFIGGQNWIYSSEKNPQVEHDIGVVSTMLILDVKLKRTATSILLCVQRPHLLVALDFLLATTEFFVPTVRSLLSDEDGDDLPNIQGAIVLDKPVYMQPDTLLSLSPRRPLIADDERFDHYVYDGQGGTLYLESDSYETAIFVGNGKKLQFKNVSIKKGECLDSCIFLGSNSSYSALKDDNVFLVSDIEHPDSEHERIDTKMPPVNVAAGSGQMEYLIELQAIGPEFTFYNASKDLGDSMLLSSKLLHAELDVLCRLVMKGDNTEITGEILGFTVESNGIRVLEPFDTSMKLSNESGRTNINLFVSDVFMNFSYSMLKLFLAIEEDILSFLRMTTKKVSVMCSQFDKVGTIKNGARGPVYAFWRARAPPGFAVLGDCLTPSNEPPSRGVLAVNTSFIRVKRPVSYKRIWPPLARFASSDQQDTNAKEGPSKNASDTKGSSIDQIYSIWFPVAPPGYVAVGCIVSKGENEPPLSSSLCISASLVSPCSLRDCIALRLIEQYSVNLAFWRVDNSFGTFLPTDLSTTVLSGKAYELRQVLLESSGYIKEPRRSNYQGNPSVGDLSQQSPQSALVSSSRLFEAVASFKLIWWNQGSPSQQKLSIWRPVVPHGMFFFGDIAVSGYEPPNACFVIRDTGDDTLVKAPYDFQLVGRIRRQKNNGSISFWLPQAPPGYVSLGCVASKDLPKLDEFSTLRCIRSDMVTGDQFPEESIWHTSDAKISKELFSIWCIGNEVGTFIVRRGRRKPPRRFALKLADISASSGSDNIAIDAEMKSFSVALYDDYGGLMVPLFNISLDGVGFNLHGRPDYMNSTVNFSLTGRSYNDKYDAWEPLIEPMDGFLRYHYDSGSPGTISQMRISTKDLNINVSASNTNLLLQAYSSWNSLSGADESSKSIEVVAPSYIGKSAIDARHRRNYFIIPQNRLGRDIFIRTTALQRYSNVIKMPSGDNKPIKVPVLKNMLDSHLNGDLARIKLSRSMVTIIIMNAELPASGGLSNSQYTAAVHLHPNQVSQPTQQQQSARTCGADADCSLGSKACIVDWKEMFFFKVDSLECYNMELMVMDIGTGRPVGLYSAPLSEIASKFHPGLPSNIEDELSWRELSSAKLPMFQEDREVEACGRIRFGVFLPSYSHYENEKESLKSSTKSGFIQISPSREGPWTSVRLNYAAAAACWRLGNDVVASELSLRNGSRYVIIRSLVCVANNTDFVIELSLKSTDNPVSADSSEHTQEDIDSGIYETDVVFEVEKRFPSVGWASVSTSTPSPANASQLSSHGEFQGVPKLNLQLGWEWVDDWHIDNSSVTDVDGWVYAPDLEHLRWPESLVDKIIVNSARQRRWIRHRRYSLSKQNNQMTLGLLNPGDKLPLPLQALVHPVSSYFLQLRPVVVNNSSEYSWSTVKLEKRKGEIFHNEGTSELHVSALMESEILLCCSEINEGGSCRTHGLWFSLIVQATEIGKDIHLDPIQDWEIIVNSPLSITNYLPLPAAYTVFSKPSNTQDGIQVKGSFKPGENIKVYGVDFLNPLYISLDLQGWDAMQEPVCLSHPRKLSSKTATIKNSATGRVIQIIFEQNEDDSIARLIRVYVPYWISSARCPPMTYRVLDMSATKEKTWSSVSLEPNKSTSRILWQLSDKEMHDGYAIASAISFKHFGLSLSLDGSEKESFGPVRTLSSLGDMDGSFDMYAYDADGNCFRAFISSKPCPYTAVPSKVITIRPYMTFTNRIGQEIQLKFGADPQRKVLHASDVRVPFICHELEASDKLQFQLQNTDWSCPIEINREDNFTVMLRKHSGFRSFVKVEIRGYEEGSRFLVVFRPGSSNGPFRIENRIPGKTICIRQTGMDDEAWIQLQPFSTTNFAWEDPYGQRLVDIRVLDDISCIIQSVNIESGVDSYSKLKEEGICLHTYEVGDIKIARLTGIPRTGEVCLNESLEPLAHKYRVSPSKMDESSGNSAPMELVVEIGTLGVSLVDHKPRELLFLHLERVFIAYSSGYDAGFTSRFKLVVGQLQLDNQLPLTVMPVLLAPENMEDASHPVFKTTITVRNENKDGTQVYPYVYVRVTDRCWRLNIHEPIIWDLVSLVQNLHLDRLSGHSDVMAVDPEIRINLIDVSEIKLKISVETAPTQRPHGVLGIWSPILSAIGNALKIQVHLRKVMHENRFMRKSAVVPSILNRIRRDLIHDPLHLIFSVDVLGMTKSTFASLSKGFAELSTDGQFLQLRSKQVWSRRITGIGDGILQGTEALAQGVAFGVSGVVKKPIESARQYGILGLAQGLGRAFLGFIVQPVSGALDFVSLTVDGISASFTRCLDILSNKATAQRIRNPRAIHANGVLTVYCEREALGQMILYLAEASRHLGCTDLFKEPSKYAWSDFYEGHFNIPYHRIVLVTNKRVMLLQCLSPDKMDKRPCKIVWDVAWEDLLALELAKAGYSKPSHIIVHLKHFKKTQSFVRVVKCSVEEGESNEPQAVRISAFVRKIWKARLLDMKTLTLKVPSSQRHVQFAWDEQEERDSRKRIKPVFKPRDIISTHSDDKRFIRHVVNFQKIWSSELESRRHCTLCPKQVRDESAICSIWRPSCPDGYISVGDIARIGMHPPNVAAVYHYSDGTFAPPLGYDLVWRNCFEDYLSPVSIWHPRAPEGFVAMGCVAVAGYEEPDPDFACCVIAKIAEETSFENEAVWTAPDAYPWSCYFYQVQSEALQFDALRQEKERSDCKPMRISEQQFQDLSVHTVESTKWCGHS